MSLAKFYEVRVVLDGAIVIARKGKGRVNKLPAMREVMLAMDKLGASGEIWMTEIGAKAWAVYGYQAGSKDAVRLRAEPK
jgi:hypothetical protein